MTWVVAGYNASNWTTFVIGSTNLIGFYGANYGDRVIVGSYQDSMHIRTAIGTDTDACAAPHLRNVKYLTSNTCSIAGGGSVNVNTILTTDCVRFQFADASSVSTENAKFYSYDGAVVTNAPTGVTFQALEQTDTAWTNAEGQSAALALDNQGASTTHNFYIAMSASPESTGEKTSFAVRLELTYY